MLLDGEEVHRQDELGREEHLQEESADDAHTIAELVPHRQRARYKSIRNSGGGDSGHNLRRKDEERSNWFDRADQNQAKCYLISLSASPQAVGRLRNIKTYSWVEHAAGHAIEDPDINSEGGTERRSNVE